MAVNYTDFDKIWASTSPLTPYEFSESQYKEGWNFVGSTPPSRQMWDYLQKNNDEKMQYLANNYLPLSGGTMAGAIVSNVSFDTPTISMSTDDNICFVFGGSDRNKGARIGLNGKDSSTNGGVFTISADDGTNTKQLQGEPDGTLTWDGKLLSAPSGRILTASGTVAKVTSTYTDIASVTANVNISNIWLVIGHTVTSASLVGVLILQEIVNAPNSNARYDGNAGGGAVSASVVTISSNTTFTLRAYSSNTSTFNFVGQIYAIPLM